MEKKDFIEEDKDDYSPSEIEMTIFSNLVVPDEDLLTTRYRLFALKTLKKIGIEVL